MVQKNNYKGLKKTKTQQKPAGAFKPELLKEKSANQQRLTIIIILIVTLATYFISLNNDFTANWDDGGYVLDNKTITSINSTNLHTIFTEFYKGNYHPLTTLSYAIEYSLVGVSPFFYHFNNLLLHLVNVLLVFWFFSLFTKRLEVAVITALFFGIHPLHVESVAWISERKDVLYAFFFLISMITYYKYSTDKLKPKKFYIISLLFFLLSLLSKSAAVPLPIVLLLLDYYNKRKFTWGTILEKIPFFALSIGFGVAAILSQSVVGALQYSNPVFSYFERIFISSYALLLYLGKMIFPFELSAMYPYPDRNLGYLPLMYYVAFALMLALAIVIFIYRKRNRDVVFGSLFFLLNIALVLQILPVGGAMFAERYTYIPYLGLFFIGGKFYCYVVDEKKKSIAQLKPILLAVFTVFTMMFCYLTFERIKVWKDGETLFTDVIKKYPNLAFAYNNRGYLYFTYKKDYERALQDYNKSLAVDPTFHRAYSNRGVLYYNTGRIELALPDFSNAIKYDKTNTDAWIGRANTYSSLKKFDLAIPDYTTYLVSMPDDEKAWLWRGTAYYKTNKIDLALSDFNHCVQIRPNDYEAYYWRGLVYNTKKNYQQAVNDLNQALMLEPSKAELYSWRGLINYNLKSYENAISDLTKAVSMNPKDAAAFINRSHAYFDTKQFANAWNDINSAGKLGFPLDKDYFLKLQALVK